MEEQVLWENWLWLATVPFPLRYSPDYPEAFSGAGPWQREVLWKVTATLTDCFSMPCTVTHLTCINSVSLHNHMALWSRFYSYPHVTEYKTKFRETG